MGVDGIYLVAGLCLLLAVVLPQLLHRFAISSPMVLVSVGLLIGFSPLPEGMSLDPNSNRAAVEHITEATVLVALMGVGLALNRPLSWRRPSEWRGWSATWRLLGITMPLTIAAVALLGWWGAGIAPAAAILLGAVLAPTDPVLASDVQVGGPDVAAGLDDGEEEEQPEGEEDEVRFALTAEAGLNDGLAFPFVYLALLVAAGGFGSAELGEWLGWYVVGKVAIGLALGVATGWLLGAVAFRSARPALRLAEQGEPLLALAALLTAYGAAEVLGGYGFLAVFAGAMTLRAAERRHHYHRAMHDVIERLERLLTLVILLFLGIAAARGLLDELDLWGVLVAVALVLVIRPLTGMLALGVLAPSPGSPGCLQRAEIPAIAFFGVRGVGSLYYLAYAAGHHDFDEQAWLWSTVGFTIILSVFVHGIAATPVMAWLDRHREEPASAG